MKNIEDLRDYGKIIITELAKVDAEVLIDEGKIDPLILYAELKKYILYLEEYTSKIHDSALKEFNKYTENEIEKVGCKISSAEYGVKWDFSRCNNIFLNDAIERMDKLKSEIDAEKTRLKRYTKRTTEIDDDTGEITTIIPPIKTSTTKLKIQF